MYKYVEIHFNICKTTFNEIVFNTSAHSTGLVDTHTGNIRTQRRNF